MIKLLLNSIFSLTIAVCAIGDGDIETGKEFTVKKGQSASGSGVKVTMLGAGRSQKAKGGDTIYCSFDLTVGGATNKLSLDVGESVAAGRNSLKLTKVDLTASPKAKDPWESNACSFIVSKAGE
ncbi:MAG: hypothetical protein ABL999_03610 [Pyrinomonadaceae bacterium]